MALSKPQKKPSWGGGLFLIGLWEQVGCLCVCSDGGGGALASGLGE